MESYGVTTTAYDPNGILAGTENYNTIEVTILSGQNLVAGSVLGKVTASGKCVLSLSGSSDGSETPYAILMEDRDASAADLVGVALITGQVNDNQLTLGTAHTIASITEGLRGLGIVIKTSVPA